MLMLMLMLYWNLSRRSTKRKDTNVSSSSEVLGLQQKLLPNLEDI